MITNKVSTNWTIIELNEICDLQNGYAFKSSDYIPFSNTLNCRMSNIRPNGEFDLEYHPKFLPDSYAEKYSSFLLKDDDVIIAMTDMTTDAKILGVPTVVSTSGKNLLLNQRVGKLIIKRPELIYFPYLKYALNRESTKKYYLRFAGGGLQLNLGKSDLLSVKIPLPPLEEQKRIAAILDKADRVRRKRQEAIRLTEELGRSIFLDMFGDPVTNSKGIETKPLGDIVTFLGGGTPARNNDKYFQGEICWASSKDMGNEILVDTQEHITQEAIDNSSTKLVPSGTLLVVVKSKILMKRLPVSRTAIDTFFNQDIKAIAPKDLSLTRYLQAHLKLGQETLLRQARGVNTEGLTLEHLRKYPVLMPKQENIIKYTVISKELEKMLVRNRESFQESENLFNSLLQRAFLGEL
jgi:type I restriction enzyme, S subunit